MIPAAEVPEAFSFVKTRPDASFINVVVIAASPSTTSGASESALNVVLVVKLSSSAAMVPPPPPTLTSVEFRSPIRIMRTSPVGSAVMAAR